MQEASAARRVTLTVLFVVLASVAGYTALLAWDRTKTLGPDGYLHGPYEVWQVAAFVIVLGLIAVVAGLRRVALVGTLAATIAVTLAWSIDAATDPYNDGLWPVGAVSVAGGTLLGFGLVAVLVEHRIAEPRHDRAVRS